MKTAAQRTKTGENVSFKRSLKEVGILLKKDRTEKASKFKKSERDGWGAAISVVFAGILVAALTYFIWQFAKEFCAIPLNGKPVTLLRQTQILTVVFAVVFFINLVGGVGKIYSAVTNAQDLSVLQVLPVSTRGIYFYKLLSVYFAQVVTCALIIVPIGVTVGIVMGNNVGYYVGILLSVPLMPVFTLMLSSLVAIPAHNIIRWFKNKFWVMLVVFVALILCGFFVYSQLLEVFERLLSKGDIQQIFNADTMNAIGAFCQGAYPINLWAELVLGQNMWRNIGVLLAIVVASGAVVLFVMHRLVGRMIQFRLQGRARQEQLGTRVFRESNSFFSLLKKEFLNVLRTPSYAFQYFAIALILPFMCYASIGILTKLLSGFLFAETDFEIAAFVVTMFAMLTNTFCATNISRDGQMFQQLKTMPLSGGKILAAKVVFCFIVSAIAVLGSVVFLCAQGYISAAQAVAVFAFSSTFALAEILFATRLDLNRPKFPTDERKELTDSSAMSVVALLGLTLSILLGAALLVISIVFGLKNMPEVRLAVVTTVAVVSAVLILGAALLYFFIGLKRTYKGEAK